jgi:Spy/CpxP family protein refolding chaperone
MKRTIGLATVILSSYLLIPYAQAQTWQDMRSDRNAIREDRDAMRHDKKELRQDLRNGDYDAARHERAEMERRRQGMREEGADLRNDWWNRHRDDDQERGPRGFRNDDD